MALSQRNIIVGAARVFYSVSDSTQGGWFKGTPQNPLPVGPDLPTFSPGTPAEDAFEGSSDWREAGLTSEGLEFTYEPDFGEVQADQLLDAALMFKQGQTVTVRTTLLEATLENLIFAWGIGSGNLEGFDNGGDNQTLSITGGELHDKPVEKALAFIGGAPSSLTNKPLERVYRLRRALQVESSSFSLSRQDATTYPVSFRCLPDPAVTSYDQYGVIVQRVKA